MGDTLEVDILSAPGRNPSEFTVLGGTRPDLLTEDRTPDTTVTEISPGLYRVAIALGDAGERYFVRIELP